VFLGAPFVVESELDRLQRGSSYTTVLPPVPPRASQDNADFVFENVKNGNGFAATTTPEPLTLWLMGAPFIGDGNCWPKAG